MTENLKKIGSKTDYAIFLYLDKSKGFRSLFLLISLEFGQSNPSATYNEGIPLAEYIISLVLERMK